jgi:hypothetical protein
VDNSDLMLDGRCACRAMWGGGMCEVWLGHCGDTCLECVSATECKHCVPNAMMMPGGSMCSCLPSWSGPSCENYLGACADACAECKGPEPENCTICSNNGYRGSEGHC